MEGTDSVPTSLHFAGAIAASNCAGAPQLSAFVGRKDATQPAPDGLVPEPFHTPDQIFDRLADASQGEFDPILTVWLLTAHTVAAANDVDPTKSGLPFDSTPELWDTQFFVETQLRGTLFPGKGGNQGEVESPLNGEIRLQSDHTIARDPRTACEWQSFVDNQPKAQQMFQFVFQVLTTLGQNQDDLVDCTEVVRRASWLLSLEWYSLWLRLGPDPRCTSGPYSPSRRHDPQRHRAGGTHRSHYTLESDAHFLLYSALRPPSPPSRSTPARRPPSPPCKSPSSHSCLHAVLRCTLPASPRPRETRR